MPSVQGLAEDDSKHMIIRPSLRLLIRYSRVLGIEAFAALTVSDPTDVYATPTQLDEELMTLTFLPRSRWQTLLNIEVIQVRIVWSSQRTHTHHCDVATKQAKGATKATGASSLLHPHTSGSRAAL